MAKLKDKKEVIDLVGKDTIFKFKLITDGIATFETVQPINRGDKGYYSYKLDVFFENNDVMFAYDSLGEFLGDLQMFELTETIEGVNDGTVIYHEKYFPKEGLSN